MNYKLLSLVAALLAVGTTHQANAQKAAAHKLVYKRDAQSTVKLQDVINIYLTKELSTLDEYLTVRKWNFVNSESGNDTEQVVYNHKNANGVLDGKLNIFFCNHELSGRCIRPDAHFMNKQHIYQVNYKLSKPLFDKLQAEVRTVCPVTSSNIGDGILSTVYRGGNVRTVFIVENKEYSPVTYTVSFGDVLPVSETKSE